MSKVGLTGAQYWVTRAVKEHPDSLARAFSSQFNVSKATAAKVIRRLVDEGWLIRHGTTRPTYEAGPSRTVFKTYPLPILHEDLVWQADFFPYLALPKNVAELVFYCFTEMVNNATDHSEGKDVELLVTQNEKETTVSVRDDGIGIFKRIALALNLEDIRFALLELSKGKLTTDPERHSGEGIFFSSRMCDHFMIKANELDYFHAASSPLDILKDQPMSGRFGTAVSMWFMHDTTRTMTEVFSKYSTDSGFAFDKTVVPVNLARIGTESLISRSQAKRLMSRFEKFRIVALDFENVDEIGQAFADELFRVFANSHPNVQLLAINDTEQIRLMSERAKNANGAIGSEQLAVNSEPS